MSDQQNSLAKIPCKDKNATNFLLEARVDNVKSMWQLLKSISFQSKSERATIFITDSGLKFVVEDCKSIQAIAFIGSDVFQEYGMEGEETAFRVDLTTLVECLHIFGHSTAAMQMFYHSYGSPLRIVLEEKGVITDCILQTMDPYDILEFSFPSTDVNKVIFRSADLKEIFNDLDPSTSYVKFLISPEPPNFCITTCGVGGKTKIEVPKDSDMVEVFQSASPVKFRYKYYQIKPAAKILAASLKVSIRTDITGLLFFQYMFQTENRQLCYVEYYCTPIVRDGW